MTMNAHVSRRRATARLAATAAAAGTAVLVLTACGSGSSGSAAGSSTAGSSAADQGGPLTIYSGRNETLVGPLLADLEESVGTEVAVRYASSSELAAQLLEEGEQTEADLFFSQDAGALGALAEAGLLTGLPEDAVSTVAAAYRDADNRWVATSARARVLAYDPDQVSTPPDSVDALLEPAYAGKVAYAPTNASFHAFVTALRIDRGDEAAKTWLERFAANRPQAYESNVLVLDAVDSGRAAIGLINHYYWHQKVAEVGADQVSARLHYLPAGDPGALVNVAGAGVIAGSEQEQAAVAAVRFLLGTRAQQYFADETAEYPIISGVRTTKHDLQPLEQVQGFEVDLGRLDSLDKTLVMLDEVGIT